MKLIEPTIVPDDKDNEEGFLTECKNSCCLDYDIYANVECYLTLLEIPDPAQNPLSLACTCKQQQHNVQLLALHVRSPKQYINKSLDEDTDNIICNVHHRDILDKKCCIALPHQIL